MMKTCVSIAYGIEEKSCSFHSASLLPIIKHCTYKSDISLCQSKDHFDQFQAHFPWIHQSCSLHSNGTRFQSYTANCYMNCHSDNCTCSDLYFQCESGGCIPASKICNWNFFFNLDCLWADWNHPPIVCKPLYHAMK